MFFVKLLDFLHNYTPLITFQSLAALSIFKSKRSYAKSLLLFFSLQSVFAFSSTKNINYYHFTLKDNTIVHVVEIDPNHFDILLKEANNECLESVKIIAKREHAVAAINGGFFFISGNRKREPTGILKIGKNWHGYAFLPRGAIGWSKDDSKVLFDRLLTKKEKNGSITILPQILPNTHQDWAKAYYILGGTPLLIQNGKLLKDYKIEKTNSSFLTEKHARSAIGLLKNGHFIFLTVDGTRNFFFKNSGISIENLGVLLYDLGCINALNLDGGGSSTLYFEGSIKNNSCGEVLDSDGCFTRKVSNSILAIPKQL